MKKSKQINQKQGKGRKHRKSDALSRKKGSISIPQRFFIFASGANMDILEACPSSEKNKYATMGAVVFMTSLLAMLSGGYAFYFVFKNIQAAIPFGIFWGIVIFNLDRYIVMSIKKKKQDPVQKIEIGQFNIKVIGVWLINWLINNIGVWLMALPRFGIAFLIALSISTPLELLLFEKRINKELTHIKNQDVSEFDNEFRQAINVLNLQITNLEQESQRKIDSIYNRKPVYKKKKEEEKNLERKIKRLDSQILRKRREANKHRILKTGYRTKLITREDGTTVERTEEYKYWVYDNIGKKFLIEVNRLKGQKKNTEQELESVREEIRNIEKESEEEIKKVKQQYRERIEPLMKQIAEKKKNFEKGREEWLAAAGSDDLLARMEALGRITDKSDMAAGAKWVITWLFIVLETAPLLVKLLTPRGPYEDMLEALEYEYRIESGEYISKINARINAILKKLEKVSALEAETFLKTEKQRIKKELETNEEILKEIAKKQAYLAKIAIKKWYEEEKKKIENSNAPAVQKASNVLHNNDS